MPIMDSEAGIWILDDCAFDGKAESAKKIIIKMFFTACILGGSGFYLTIKPLFKEPPAVFSTRGSLANSNSFETLGNENDGF